MKDDDKRQNFPGSWRLHTDDIGMVRAIRLDASRVRRRIAGPPVSVLARPIVHGRKDTKERIRSRRARLKHGKKVARRLIKKKRGDRVLRRGEDEKVFNYRPSVILDNLAPNRKKKFVASAIQRKKRKGYVDVEFKNMSFTHNPRETMNRLGALLDQEADAFSINIDFHDQQCLDVGPYLLLSLIKKGMPDMFWGGDISLSMSKVMAALELDQELGITVPIQSQDDPLKDVYPFPVHRRRHGGSSESDTRYTDKQSHEKIAGNLQDAIDQWLGVTANQKLNRVGRRNVLRLVTETLDNAERHGDIYENQNDADWIVAGFMARRGKGEEKYYRCHLAFLSTGTTIDETIATAPEPTRSKMADYVNRHLRHVGSRAHAEGHLRTVFALQDGVTRSEVAIKERRNGTGLQDILEFYSDLAAVGAKNTNASLAVVSGRTCILCNSPYMHGARMNGEDSERELWFNEANSQELPPDNRNVIELDRCLKGTLISMAFTLDLEYLERTVDRAN